MTLAEYQKQVDKWLQEFEKPYWEPLSQLARLSEEVGELARAYNHKYGDKIKKPEEAEDNIAYEMGDILFDLICMANTEGIDLDEALNAVLDKIAVRDRNRFPRKAG